MGEILEEPKRTQEEPKTQARTPCLGHPRGRKERDKDNAEAQRAQRLAEEEKRNPGPRHRLRAWGNRRVGWD